MERERGDLAEDLGREAPERREAAARAAATVGFVWIDATLQLTPQGFDVAK